MRFETIINDNNRNYLEKDDIDLNIKDNNRNYLDKEALDISDLIRRGFRLVIAPDSASNDYE